MILRGWILLLCVFLGSSAKAQTQKEINKALATNPLAREILLGKKIQQIVSCAVVDGMTWKFRPDGRRARVIVRDHMRLNSSYEFALWEISQVMDTDGFTTFVFRRALKNNKVEAFAIRDYLYNRIIEKETQTVVVESKSLKNLIGSPAFIFTTADGGTASYFPGAYKSSYLMISHPTEAGVLKISPVFIKSMICYRPEEELEGLTPKEPKDADKKNADKPSAPAAAPKR